MERLLRYYSDETTLFGGRYMPITDSISFINAPLELIVDRFAQWRFPERFHDMSMVVNPGLFEEQLKGLEPLRAEPSYLLTATTSTQWTAVLSDCLSGLKQDRLSNRIGICLGVRTVDVMLVWPAPSKSRSRRQFGVSLQFNEPSGSFPLTHSYLATVRNPDPFHDEFDVYRHYRSLSPNIGINEGSDKPLDRFNPHDLIAYCRSIGIDVFNEGFYTANSYRVFDDDLLEKIKQEAGKLSTYEAVQESEGLRALSGR